MQSDSNTDVRHAGEQWEALPPGAKIVGRRRPSRVDLLSARPFFKFSDLRPNPRSFVPRGVYRFKTFPEAEAWNLRMMTRR